MCKGLLCRSIIFFLISSFPLGGFAPIIDKKTSLRRLFKAFRFFFHAKTMTVLKRGPFRFLCEMPLFYLRSTALSLLTKFSSCLIIILMLLFISARPRTSRFLRLWDPKIFCSEFSSIAHLLRFRYSSAIKAEESVNTLSCSGDVRLPLTSSLCSKNSPSSSTAGIGVVFSEAEQLAALSS